MDALTRLILGLSMPRAGVNLSWSRAPFHAFALILPQMRQATARAHKPGVTNFLAAVAFVWFCCCNQPAPQSTQLHSASSSILPLAPPSRGPALSQPLSTSPFSRFGGADKAPTCPQAQGREDVPSSALQTQVIYWLFSKITPLNKQYYQQEHNQISERSSNE